MGQEQAFAVETQGAGGQGRLDVRISAPSRRPVPCKVEPGAAGGPHRVQYVPPEEGPYKVDVTYDGHPVPGSPFTVEAVLPPDPSKVSWWCAWCMLLVRVLVARFLVACFCLAHACCTLLAHVPLLCAPSSHAPLAACPCCTFLPCSCLLHVPSSHPLLPTLSVLPACTRLLHASFLHTFVACPLLTCSCCALPCTRLVHAPCSHSLIPTQLAHGFAGCTPTLLAHSLLVLRASCRCAVPAHTHDTRALHTRGAPCCLRAPGRSQRGHGWRCAWCGDPVPSHTPCPL